MGFSLLHFYPCAVLQQSVKKRVKIDWLAALLNFKQDFKREKVT
jgi:hypothetical protein